jgi:hypothetical protein
MLLWLRRIFRKRLAARGLAQPPTPMLPNRRAMVGAGQVDLRAARKNWPLTGGADSYLMRRGGPGRPQACFY